MDEFRLLARQHEKHCAPESWTLTLTRTDALGRVARLAWVGHIANRESSRRGALAA